jgi:chemotaxis signal transduction protein
VSTAALVEAGGSPLAVPAQSIREALWMVGLTPVPPAPHWLPGVMDLRGRVVPVVDVGARLGTGPVEVRADTPILVVEATDGTMLGLLVDQLHGLHQVSDAPETVESGGSDAPVGGAVRADGRLARILDVDAIAGELAGAQVPA